MTQAATPAAPPVGAATTPDSIAVPDDLRRLLARSDGHNDDLKRLLTGELIFSRLTPEALAAKGRIERAILLVEGMKYLGKILTDEVMDTYFMPLQNWSRGFLTDSKDGYHRDVVRGCLIDAFTRGLMPTENQINILSGRMYVTRNGMTALLKAHAGLTDLRIVPNVPDMRGDGAVIQYVATWKLDGVANRMERDIAVRVNKGQSFDAVIGKGDRKIKAAIYEQLTGTVFTEEGEVEGDDEPRPHPKTKTHEAAPLAGLKAKQAAQNDAEKTTTTGSTGEPTDADLKRSLQHDDVGTPTNKNGQRPWNT